MKLITFVLILLILTGAFITNPTMDDFEYYIGSNIDAELQEVTGRGLLNWALDRVIRSGVSLVTYRRDYKLFSIFYVQLPVVNYELRYLGIFRNFYLLNGIRDEDIPVEYPDKENDVMEL